MKKLFIALFIFITHSSYAQDMKSFVAEGEAKYFDFWEGNWFEIKDDNSVDSASSFKVVRSVHPACFTEEWQSSNGMKSIATRAWDKTNNKWGFVWVSDNGLYQVWDSRKIDNHWYIYKQFTINGDTYLSRQAFIPQPDGTVLRISEKSYDDKKWELRFKQRLKKVQ